MRVAENLNQALHTLLAENERLHLLGEDILDPYGGAFRVTKGLSTRFPQRVLTTPLSEGAIAGAGAGLALAGDPAIVEIMFGDFVALAFDQIVNFAAKSVSMYGRTVPIPLVVRCPSGGGRGYGPTHSQSLQKHFVGVPGLDLYEMSPFHDNTPLLRTMLGAARPALFFEDKVLYTTSMFEGGVVDDLFSYDVTDGVARVFADDPGTFDAVLVVPGGLVHQALAAARSLLLEQEVTCLILVPTRLHPFDPAPLLPSIARARAVCVAEEGTAGGTWGAGVAHQVHTALGGARRPITLVSAADAIIPTARHLEDRVLVQSRTIHDAVLGALRD